MKRPTPDTDAVAAYEGNWDTKALRMTVHARKLERERDEARSIAQQLIHIASHCLGWHDNANPETIAEAIKRWNASKK